MQAVRATEISGGNFSAYPETDPALKVVLVYEDFEMGTRGKHLFDLIAKEAGGAGAAQLMVWRFDSFHSAELTRAASRQAAAADVIIVAPRDPSHLPPPVQAWLEQWPLHRQLKPGALVAVFHPSVSSSVNFSDAALLLWRAAGRAQMDFICRKAGPATHPPGTTVSATTTARWAHRP